MYFSNQEHGIASAEIFYVDEHTAKLARERVENDTDELSVEGWYYWPRHPGCLPDGPAIGPFERAVDAIQDLIDSTE